MNARKMFLRLDTDVSHLINAILWKAENVKQSQRIQKFWKEEN